MKFHCNHCCQQGSEILKKIISFKIRGISALCARFVYQIYNKLDTVEVTFETVSLKN